jgi:hypothetical protein
MVGPGNSLRSGHQPGPRPGVARSAAERQLPHNRASRAHRAQEAGCAIESCRGKTTAGPDIRWLAELTEPVP